jgi:hypothetical protein
MVRNSKGKIDARPVGALRPRYAARGEAACEGDGEGGSEPVDEPKERSGEGLVNASLYDCARPRGSDALPGPVPTLPGPAEVEKASWRWGVVCISFSRAPDERACVCITHLCICYHRVQLERRCVGRDAR